MTFLFQGPEGALEGEAWEPEDAKGESTEPRAAAVVCHPHPLHGGTMKTTAVFRTARGLQRAGLAVLRFNFRGVGKSEGTHDGQGGEEGDAQAAFDEVQRRWPGIPTWGAGFSFGSRTMSSLARRDPRVQKLICVALPVRAYDCSWITEVTCPSWLIFAGNDEFGTRTEFLRQFPSLGEHLETDEIPDTDHFFRGTTQDLQARVEARARLWLGSSTTI